MGRLPTGSLAGINRYSRFYSKNYTPYEGDESFLQPATEATKELWNQVMEGIKVENSTHAPLDFDPDTPSTITSHKPGYINKDLEKIVGLQTDAPFKESYYAIWRYSYDPNFMRNL